MSFRVYVQVGCPFCAQVVEFLQRNGVPFSTIEVMNDPVINRGLLALLGQPVLPVTVCFSPQKIIKGADLEKLNDAINAYRSFGTQPFADVAPDGKAAEAAPPVGKTQ